MATETTAHRHRLTAPRRDGDQVTPLELFFDLVFVLALTQCTQLMSDHPTWTGLAQGLLVLGVLWWSWIAYAWLTSAVDPTEDLVRGVLFVAMAGLLIVSLSVTKAFGSLGLELAIAYGVVRMAHIALFVLASKEDPDFRRPVTLFTVSTVIAIAILVAASTQSGTVQIALWALALAMDMGGPYVIDAQGWRLVAPHFAERHGLIVIIALGESIVAIGVALEGSLSPGQGVAAVVGMGLAAGMWWLYFDVVALVAARRLEHATPGRHQNAMARDSYNYLHLPMIAGIILVALGIKKTLGHVEDPLKLVPAVALLAGLAMYLLGHVAFRYRHIHTLNTRRMGLAAILVALVPVALEIPAIATVTIATVLVWILIVVETRSYGESRASVQHEHFAPGT
jgi:low temperature requirement protein LtrA